MKIAVTAGQSWVDIDAYSCIVAYTELLRLEGQAVEAVNPGALNASIPPYLATLGACRTEPSSHECRVILVDISDPAYVSGFVKPEAVIEVFDHHLGFETYWQEKIGNKAQIEFIGACATLIWEVFVARGQAKNISMDSATLLAAAIVSNTLNFNASMTNERDRQAYSELSQIAKLPSNFIANYFLACEAGTLKDIAAAIKNDTKIQVLDNLGVTLTIGQLELWDSASFIRSNESIIRKTFGLEPYWMLTSPSISEGLNRLYTTNAKVKDWLTKAINASWDGDFGSTKRLYLRKEIIPALKKLTA